MERMDQKGRLCQGHWSGRSRLAGTTYAGPTRSAIDGPLGMGRITIRFRPGESHARGHVKPCVGEDFDDSPSGRRGLLLSWSRRNG